MNKLTFLLPLKDRPSYTKIWLQHNLRPECNYFVADGSLGDENEALFRELRLPNLTYVRYQKDLSIDCYVEKMQQSVRKIKTNYVMACDNDDFINFKGVFQCINALEDDPEVVCAGGPIYGVMQMTSGSAMPRYSLPVKIIDAEELHNRTGFDALVQLFKSYRYLWYSVFRTESYLDIWNDIRHLQISNFYLVEILQTELAFCHGKYARVKTNHYIRLKNPVTSCASEMALNDVSHNYKIYFDEEYRSQVLRMSGHVAKRVGVELPQLLSEFTNYYIPRVAEHPQSFRSRIYARLVRIHEIVLRKLHIFLPIEYGIAFINIVSRHATR